MRIAVVKASELGNNWLAPFAKLHEDARRESPSYLTKPVQQRAFKLSNGDWDILVTQAKALDLTPGELVSRWIKEHTSCNVSSS